MDGLGLAVFLVAVSLCTNDEIHCSPYHYHEQMLAKIVRMEFRLEQFEKYVKSTGDSRAKEYQPCEKCPDTWIPFQGSCYLFADGPYSYNDANDSCSSLGAHLVYVESNMENEFLRRQLSSLKDSNYWMGLTDIVLEGTFQWDDGNELSFTDWSPGQPDNYRNEDCVYFSFTRKYHWNDLTCSDRLKFICEK